MKGDAQIKANFGVGFVREQRGFDGICFSESNVIRVHEGAEFRSEFQLGAQPVDEDARIDEIRLALRFAGAQIRNETAALFEIHERASEVKALASPVAERAACEVGVVEDCVKTVRVTVLGVIIAGGVKE